MRPEPGTAGSEAKNAGGGPGRVPAGPPQTVAAPANGRALGSGPGWPTAEKLGVRRPTARAHRADASRPAGGHAGATDAGLVPRAPGGAGVPGGRREVRGCLGPGLASRPAGADAVRTLHDALRVPEPDGLQVPLPVLSRLRFRFCLRRHRAGGARRVSRLSRQPLVSPRGAAAPSAPRAAVGGALVAAGPALVAAGWHVCPGSVARRASPVSREWPLACGAA